MGLMVEMVVLEVAQQYLVQPIQLEQEPQDKVMLVVSTLLATRHVAVVRVVELER